MIECKMCNRCHKVKSIADFYVKRKWGKVRQRPWLSSVCKSCHCAQLDAVRRKPENKERINRYARNSIRKRRFGLMGKDIAELLEKQNFSCAICKSYEKHRQLSVDHDHVTGKVRGILCSRCNMAIGLFKDNPKLLAAAVEYLSATHNFQFSVLLDKQLVDSLEARFLRVN